MRHYEYCHSGGKLLAKLPRKYLRTDSYVENKKNLFEELTS